MPQNFRCIEDSYPLSDLSGYSETDFSVVRRPAQVDAKGARRSKLSQDGLVSTFPFTEFVGTDSTGDNDRRSLLQWC